MPNDAALAAIVERSYSDISWRAGELTALYTLSSGYRIIAFPGTRMEIGDWLRDLDAIPRWTKYLGICHRGFFDGTIDLIASAPAPAAYFDGATFTGHSMGGAFAILAAALAVAAGCKPRAVVTCGAPRCASWRVRRLLPDTPLRLYRNGDDPVPDVPWLPGLYVHPRRLIEIGAPALDPIYDHHISAYLRALVQ